MLLPLPGRQSHNRIAPCRLALRPFDRPRSGRLRACPVLDTAYRHDTGANVTGNNPFVQRAARSLPREACYAKPAARSLLREALVEVRFSLSSRPMRQPPGERAGMRGFLLSPSSLPARPTRKSAITGKELPDCANLPLTLTLSRRERGLSRPGKSNAKVSLGRGREPAPYLIREVRGLSSRQDCRATTIQISPTLAPSDSLSSGRGLG